MVTEGNYLLHWPEVRPLLDEVWYLDPDPADRLAALIARHVAFGRSPEQAREWVAAHRRAQRRADRSPTGTSPTAGSTGARLVRRPPRGRRNGGAGKVA